MDPHSGTVGGPELPNVCKNYNRQSTIYNPQPAHGSHTSGRHDSFECSLTPDVGTCTSDFSALELSDIEILHFNITF